MPEINVAMEVERVMNLVRGFGWEKIKEERVNGNLDITIRKAVATQGAGVLKEEVEVLKTAAEV